MIVGLISDTHGLLRPEAVSALRGCDRIVHAGDIGGREIVTELRRIAPVAAVRGNNDRDSWGRRLPAARSLRLGQHRAVLLHAIADLELDPAQHGYALVISGHSHAPNIDRREGVLYVNPGSAGPRRFTLPIALGELRISKGSVRARIKVLG